MQSITSILIVTKAGHAAAESTSLSICRWLMERGVTCSILSAASTPSDIVSAARNADAVLVLGGDGTFIGVGRKLAGLPIPLLGINFGQIGFLTELPADDWHTGLQSLLEGRMVSRTCLVLGWELSRDGSIIREGHAANDVVVGRGAIARVLPVRVVVDGEDMGFIRSDGVIVSTPLGSSAYALSAHGPLVHPDVQALTLTPISPFFRSFPPMVLPADCRVRLETDPAAPDAFLTVDGQEGIPLHGGDVVVVHRIETGLHVLSCRRELYFHRLRERGFIQTPDAHPGAQTSPDSAAARPHKESS